MDSATASGAANAATELDSVLKQRRAVDAVNDEQLVEETDEVEREHLESAGSAGDAISLHSLESVAMPVIFTLLAIFVRMYKIGANKHVVWDEAHFGKFGSQYLRHEFYHDVHPPLGKMLVGLSGYIAGYNGSFSFTSGEEYPEYVDFVKMRIFNAAFSAMCVPVAYFTAKAIGFSLPVVWFFTITVLCENSYTTLGRFILLDSMLLFFTVTSFYCFVKFHNERKAPFALNWWKWLLLTGFNLGCAISVKMVGLFIITLVGIYTVVDLWNFLGDKGMSWRRYLSHWAARIIGLIMIPMAVFMFSFYIHFKLLSHSGSGDSNMSSLFQANLIGSDVGRGPRDVAVGSSFVTFKNQALGGQLLHSHVQLYPEGSGQQQVTGYGYNDSNNVWYFDRVRESTPWSRNETEVELVTVGEQYRIVHNLTHRNLHSHEVHAAVSSTEWEVSGYGDDTIGDFKDYWVLEFMNQPGKENKTVLHPLTTSFRIKNTYMNCYLAQTNEHYPEWGFRQMEIACLRNPFKKDKRTWWNVETNEDERLPDRPDNFRFPGTNFFKDFVRLNLAMMASNNALIPEEDKLDVLASSAWQWPTLYLGLRICSWGDQYIKYFLLGTPVSTWASSLAVVGLCVAIAVLVLRWQRQYKSLKSERSLNLFLMGGLYPLLAWGLHYAPFVIMSRVTYVHHYLPALYFALIILAYSLQVAMDRLNRSTLGRTMAKALFLLASASVVLCFIHFSPMSFGMEGPARDYSYLKWVSTWDIYN
ncbi:dolichyl-phosphate-mannose-protein mannosyltransferase PMT2 KNAG_0D04860 [Huiozyma naganishii CBS 8797]|uniref:Dolichyl-phosphate-mannose--protein mannosyltransferase n=1 Tax=Huiozyma naganishii (strain ATCC MYA-139 / BCRC 22969 / CBS 8797 / KCTC 17520 / NBRC 10181 / NCYC 3082 / Yp74L-3) TaxID=1071383 RepID=J7R5T9_HUIN7|nr:hypothetical protein KNAG_0D04860 [Kazachstania naganishii CBS 8797]CCK70225.1 hypothetical protein KNAG_0D04860 [Kazachstania naganishii CBS 8797]